MRIIAHRGLMDGPDKYLENKQVQIVKALEKGFDVEIDVTLKRITKRKNGALTFDSYNPQNFEDVDLLELYHDGGLGSTEALSILDIKEIAERYPTQIIYLHAKTVETVAYLTENRVSLAGNIQYFFHANDSVTLTSQGFLWTHPDIKFDSYKSRYGIWSIAVLPELNMEPSQFREILKDKDIFAVCTDFPNLMKRALKEKD